MAEAETLEPKPETTPAAHETKGLRIALYTLAAILTFLAGCWTAHLYCEHHEQPPVVEPVPQPDPKPKPWPWKRAEQGRTLTEDVLGHFR